MVRLRKRVPARTVAEAARSHSQVFHLAAKRCNEFERLPSGRLRFLSVPTLVCYAFSIEIGLKALALYEKGKARRNEHDLRKLFTFLPGARRPFVYELVEATEQGWRLEKPFTDFKPKLGYLIRWAAERGVISPQQSEWFEHRRRMRNTIAHGHNMIVAPSFALRHAPTDDHDAELHVPGCGHVGS